MSRAEIVYQHLTHDSKFMANSFQLQHSNSSWVALIINFHYLHPARWMASEPEALSSSEATEGSTVRQGTGDEDSPATLLAFDDVASEVTDLETAEDPTMPVTVPCPTLEPAVMLPEKKALDPRLVSMLRNSVEAGLDAHSDMPMLGPTRPPTVTVNVAVEKALPGLPGSGSRCTREADTVSTKKPELNQKQLETLRKRKHKKNVKDKKRKRRKKQAARESAKAATNTDTLQDVEAKTVKVD